jgi:hypothetical protein
MYHRPLWRFLQLTNSLEGKLHKMLARRRTMVGIPTKVRGMLTTLIGLRCQGPE